MVERSPYQSLSVSRPLELRQRLSEIAKAQWQDPAFRAKALEGMRDPQAIEKRVSKRRGKPSGMKGKHHSAATRAFLSEQSRKRWEDPQFRERGTQANREISRKRKNNPSYIEKLRKAMTGKKLSKESIEKMRRTKIGKKASAETRAKMSKSHEERWRDPRYRARQREGYSRAYADRDIDQSLWNVSKKEGIRRRIVKEGFMTRAELERLKFYFEVEKGKVNPPEALIEKLSMAVANLID